MTVKEIEFGSMPEREVINAVSMFGRQEEEYHAKGLGLGRRVSC